MVEKKDIREHLGLVHVYTGDGKGKTTAALGLALRAIGNDLNVIMIQFMKSPQYYGEYEISKSMKNLTLLPMGRSCLVNAEKPQQEDYDAAEAAMAKAKESIHSGKFDLVILDEVNVAIHFHLIDKAKVLELVKARPPHVELVLTGRYAPKELIEVADLVTEMKCIKHPYERGVPAREGIER
jgi:cob(I)alamin adenosyltransferase